MKFSPRNSLFDFFAPFRWTLNIRVQSRDYLNLRSSSYSNFKKMTKKRSYNKWKTRCKEETSVSKAMVNLVINKKSLNFYHFRKQNVSHTLHVKTFRKKNKFRIVKIEVSRFKTRLNCYAILFLLYYSYY